MRMFAAFLIITFPVLLISCSKPEASAGAEHELYGKWVMGPNPMDTIEFIRVGNRNIMRSWFPQGYMIYSETPYKFANEKLRLKYFSIDEYRAISTFTWTQQGVEFQVAGFELYPFMSSTTIFTYRKI
jgi:hypothetical protein